MGMKRCATKSFNGSKKSVTETCNPNRSGAKDVEVHLTLTGAKTAKCCLVQLREGYNTVSNVKISHAPS